MRTNKPVELQHYSFLKTQRDNDAKIPLRTKFPKGTSPSYDRRGQWLFYHPEGSGERRNATDKVKEKLAELVI